MLSHKVIINLKFYLGILPSSYSPVCMFMLFGKTKNF